MTYRDYLERYYPNGVQGYIEDEGEEELIHGMDEVMSFWDFVDAWCRVDSPNARAYRLLENLDLGPDFNSPDAVGHIEFMNSPNPVSSYLGVHTQDLVSVSLLQERLNQLNTGIHVNVWEGACQCIRKIYVITQITPQPISARHTLTDSRRLSRNLV